MLLLALTLMIHADIEAAAAIGTATMAAVAAEVTAIWRPYADVVFAAGTSEGPDDLHLKIVDQVPAGRQMNEMGLGWIEFRGSQPASTITVSARAARRLADSAVLAGSPLSELPSRVRDEFVTHALSRSIAHEIGHYLLRSTAHSDRGLMRARFPTADLMDGAIRRFQLEPTQIAALPSPPRLDEHEVGRSAAAAPPSPLEGRSTPISRHSYQDDCP